MGIFLIPPIQCFSQKCLLSEVCRRSWSWALGNAVLAPKAARRDLSSAGARPPAGVKRGCGGAEFNVY